MHVHVLSRAAQWSAGAEPTGSFSPCAVDMPVTGGHVLNGKSDEHQFTKLAPRLLATASYRHSYILSQTRRRNSHPGAV